MFLTGLPFSPAQPCSRQAAAALDAPGTGSRPRDRYRRLGGNTRCALGHVLGMMGATIAGLLTTVGTSAAKRLFGFIKGYTYYPGIYRARHFAAPYPPRPGEGNPPGRLHYLEIQMHDIYTEITQRIVTALEAGTPPWVRPWSGEADPTPMNAETRRPYRGVNFLTLTIEAQAHGYSATVG